MGTHAEGHERVLGLHLPDDERGDAAHTNHQHSDDVAGLPLLLGRAGNGERHQNESENYEAH